MRVHQKKSQQISPAPKKIQRREPILTLKTGGNEVRRAQGTQGDAMNTELSDTTYMSSDMYEIGLMAAASPEFAERLLRAMLGAEHGEGSKAPAASTPAAA